MQTKLFLDNTQALFEVDQPLAYALRALHKREFDLNEDLNFIHKENQESLYSQGELEFQVKDFAKFENYPVLYFFGFGNGYLINFLLQNPKHKHIIVFESNLSILALAFCLFDFCEALRKERLIIFDIKNVNFEQLNVLFTYEHISTSAKIYHLEIQSSFYAKHYEQQIKDLNSELIEVIRFLALTKGNDPKDSLTGIEHFLENAPKMIKAFSFRNFLEQRRNKVQNAIVVSTGPSLIKQLPLLKQYANRASIFCADSAYPILAKEGIKPDYVLSLERVDFTSEFFNNDFGAFDEGILFIIASLTHKNTINYLEKNNRSYMLVSRPFMIFSRFKLDEFGYLGVGFSVANMAYELAAALRHENIILIGQDLAYGEDGSSHPKEHIYGDKDSLNEEEFAAFNALNLEVEAYGGGKIMTSLSWQLFRQNYQRDIIATKSRLNIKTYNATEGGARIEGTIEKPFKWCCEELLKEILDKPFNKPCKLEEKQRKFLLKRAEKKGRMILLKAKAFSKKCKEEFKKLQNELKKDEIDFTKLEAISFKLEGFARDFAKESFFSEIFTAMHYYHLCDLVKFRAQNTDILEVLNAQNLWFNEALAYLESFNQSLEYHLNKWSENEI